MSEVRDQYETETGEKALYRKGASDYHTLRYVEWLESRVTAEDKLRAEIMDKQTRSK